MSDLEIEFTNLDDDDLIALGESDENILFDAGQKAQKKTRQRRTLKTFKKIEKAKTKFNNEDPSSFLNMSNRARAEESDDSGVEEDLGTTGVGNDNNDSGSDMMSDDEGANVGHDAREQVLPALGYKTIDDEKLDLLNKLQRLSAKGHATKNLTIYSDIHDIRAEYQRITYGIEIDSGTKFARRMLVTCVTGIEFLNKTFDPFDVDLEGFSESTHENIDDYDAVLEELVVKYRSSAKIAPELKLIMMLGGSAAQFHITKTMFKAMPHEIQQQQQQQGMTGPASVGIENLMSNFMNAGDRPPTVSSRMEREPPRESENDAESVSDIVSEAETSASREINVAQPKSVRKRRSKKDHVNVVTI